MVKDHSDIGLLFQISSKGYLNAPFHRQDSKYHNLLLHQLWNTGWNEK